MDLQHVPTRPPSVVRQRTMWVGLASFLGAIVCAKFLQPADRLLAFIAILLALALPVLVPDVPLARIRDAVRGARLSDARRAKRVGTKLLGLAATWWVILLAYVALPLYRDGQAEVLLAVLRLVGPCLLVLTPLYVWLTDLVMPEPEDGCYMAGLAVLGRWAEIDRAVLHQYALGWVIKGFFLPLMILFAYRDFEWWLELDLPALLATEFGWYQLPYRFLYFSETLWGVVGYCLTYKLCGTHIRSAEPTMLGWVVCLACYPPFWTALYPSYLAYEDEFFWAQWLSGPARYAWGAAILVLTAIYAWATFSFGPRFSNLTHRGIVTNGPYRWTKHPAYISKNLTWWMISIPFVPQMGGAEALRQCLLLAGVNIIYFLRARTEERHLLADPVYRAYALWIAEHGLLARLKRAFNRRQGSLGWQRPAGHGAGSSPLPDRGVAFLEADGTDRKRTGVLTPATRDGTED